MSYLLDTNTASLYLRGDEGVVRKLRRCSPADVAVSAITAMELQFGAERRKHPKLTAAVKAFLGGITVLPFDDRAAHWAGKLRAQLEGRGERLGYADSLIAGHALAVAAILVTSDADFARVKGLRRESWASG